MANSNRLRCMLGAGVSITALCAIAAPAAAQTVPAAAAAAAAPQEAADAPAAKDVVITGVRKALESARQRKRTPIP